MSIIPSVNFKSHLADLFAQALRAVAPEAAQTDIVIERPKQAAHGDYACSLAMQLAKPLRKPPRNIAQALIDALPVSEVVEKVEIAGAGFINVFITAAAKQATVKAVLQSGDVYGRGTLGAGRKAQVEFVSANPTGPLHVGHGRGAAYGASLANVLDARAVHLAALHGTARRGVVVPGQRLPGKLCARYGETGQRGAWQKIPASG